MATKNSTLRLSATPPNTLHAAYGDGGKIETADELMARMTAKYGAPSAGPTQQPAVQQPAQQPQPKAQPAPQQQGIIGILKGRAAQIDKAVNGYANGGEPGAAIAAAQGITVGMGGKIEGKGSPTSDSIPATVRETGEQIRVSTQERILSKAQDAFLEEIAQASGFDSLNALLQAGTGQPVGPTLKAGKRAAATGIEPELDPSAYRGTPVVQPTVAGHVGAATEAVPTLGSAQFGRTAPAGTLSGPAGGLTLGAFGPKAEKVGSGLSGIDQSFVSGEMQQPVKAGRDPSGIITTDTAKAAMVEPMQRSGGISGSIDMAGVNGILARENKARGEMIDSMIKANGGNGIAILGDENAADKANVEKTQRWREDDLIAKAKNNPAAGQLANTIAQGGNQLAIEGVRQVGQARGQDLNYASDIARNGITARGQDVTMRGQDIGAQGQRENNQLSAVRTGLDVERFGLEKQAAQRQQAASDALVQATASGDPAKVAQARQAAVAAGLKVEPAASLQHVETERGAMVFDPRTGRMTPATGPDGAPVGSGKALTEFQGKSTGFGMRAQEASRLIDTVGQGGKVQPSLVKRAVEAVPLVGEGLGMAANGLQSPEQQQVEQAQRNFVNAVLRQESGAAISQSEFDNARKQYFPQPNDTPEVIAQKQANREMAINGFRVSAGPGARNIGGQPAQSQQQPAAAPKVGMVDGKHVFLGGNPADPASWAEVR